MSDILDKEENFNDKKNSSWKPILITNGIFILILSGFALLFFIDNDGDIYIGGIPLLEKIYFSLLFVSISMITINLFLTSVSLMVSKKYYKKWLLSVLFGVLLFLISLGFAVITEIIF